MGERERTETIVSLHLVPSSRKQEPQWWDVLSTDVKAERADKTKCTIWWWHLIGGRELWAAVTMPTHCYSMSLSSSILLKNTNNCSQIITVLFNYIQISSALLNIKCLPSVNLTGLSVTRLCVLLPAALSKSQTGDRAQRCVQWSQRKRGFRACYRHDSTWIFLWYFFPLIYFDFVNYTIPDVFSYCYNYESLTFQSFPLSYSKKPCVIVEKWPGLLPYTGIVTGLMPSSNRWSFLVGLVSYFL